MFLAPLQQYLIPSRPLQVEDPEALLSVLKSCLRTSNQHLTNATLSALPQLFPTLISRPISTLPSSSISPSASTSSVASALIDTATLRQVLISFLPSGGLIERLGDKEKAQAKAREALVILGGFAFRSGSTSAMSARAREGKGPETPLMIFERFLRESGLASKVWKVREQVSLLNTHNARFSVDLFLLVNTDSPLHSTPPSPVPSATISDVAC